jgi:hypothetical protein
LSKYPHPDRSTNSSAVYCNTNPETHRNTHSTSYSGAIGNSNRFTFRGTNFCTDNRTFGCSHNIAPYTLPDTRANGSANNRANSSTHQCSN